MDRKTTFFSDRGKKKSKSFGFPLLSGKMTMKAIVHWAFFSCSPISNMTALMQSRFKKLENAFCEKFHVRTNTAKSNHEQSKLITFDSIASSSMALFTSNSILFNKYCTPKLWNSFSVSPREETWCEFEWKLKTFSFAARCFRLGCEENSKFYKTQASVRNIWKCWKILANWNYTSLN